MSQHWLLLMLDMEGGKKDGSKALGNGEQRESFSVEGTRGHKQIDAGKQGCELMKNTADM